MPEGGPSGGGAAGGPSGGLASPDAAASYSPVVSEPVAAEAAPVVIGSGEPPAPVVMSSPTGPDVGLVDLTARVGAAAGIEPGATGSKAGEQKVPVAGEQPASGVNDKDAEAPPPVVPSGSATEDDGKDTETSTPKATGAEGDSAKPKVEDRTPKKTPEEDAALRNAEQELLENAAALTPGNARLALLALAGQGKVWQLASEAVRMEMQMRMRTVPLAERNMLGKIKGIVGLPFAPLEQRAHGVMRASYESARDQGQKRGVEFTKLGAMSLQILKSGTPEMRALAMDLELALDVDALARMPAGEDRTKFEAGLKSRAEARVALTGPDGEKIPNQFRGLATQIGELLEPGGKLQPADLSNPVRYVQRQLGNAMLDGKARTRLLEGLTASGQLSAADGKEFDKMLRLPYNNVAQQGLKSAVEATGIMGIGSFIALWLQMKMGKGKRQAAHA